MRVSFKSISLSLLCITVPQPFSTDRILASTLLTSSQSTSAKDAAGWNPKVTTVSVFKNGLGFFTREGEAQLKDGWVHTSELPPAAFGTLAIYSSNPDQMVDLIGVGEGEVVTVNDFETNLSPNSTRSKNTSQPQSSAQDILSPFVGSIVEITLIQGRSKSKVKGQIESLTSEFAIFRREVIGDENGEASSVPPSGAFAVEGDLNLQPLALPLELIASVRRLKSPTRIRVVAPSGQGVSQSTLHMAYLRKDILWLPEYTLKILDDETAELTLRGTLINEAEDIIDADVNFVVGVPHFVHSDLYAPLAIGHSLRAIGNAIPPNSVPAQVMTQVMNRAVLLNSNGIRTAFSNADGSLSSTNSQSAEPTQNPGTPFSELLASLPQSESAGSGDYSVYTKKNITVRKGERASVTLMTTKISYGHRYEWNSNEDIRHLLTLENSTDLPWTTGPCLAISDGKPLSEDILKYTPTQARGDLSVTTAVNTFQQVKESEIDRKLNAHSPSPNQNFDLVKLRGTIKLISHEKNPISLRIKRAIPGKPLEVSGKGEMNMDSERLKLVDRSGSVEWNVELKPREELTLSYVYERYISSN